MEQVTDVSIVIVNYNTLHVLKPCIDSIEAHTEGINYEIIVVDNGSTDGSKAMMGQDPRLTWIDTGENLGFGRANNMGLKRARGKYILFLNSDTLLVNNAIAQMHNFATHYEGCLGALGCILENSLGEPIHSYGAFPCMRDDFSKLLLTPIRKALGCHQAPPTAWPVTWMRVDYVTGADLMVARSVLDECGAFDPAFFMYCEETEMEHRFMLRGYDNILLRGPRIIHLEGEGSRDGKTSQFIRDCLRQQKSEYIYFKLTRPRWKYWLYRMVHPILRQTLWLNPHVSLSDKWTMMRQLFVRTGI